ncbi:MAG: cation transporter, partial [Rhodoplanes sp.]
MSLAAEIKSHAQAAETAPPHVVLDSGMTCAACATRVEAALRQVPRVGQASVNLALERADVVLRSSAVTPSQLAEAVERIGYRAHPRASSLAERRREEQEREAARADAERRQLVLLVASAALTAPLLLPMIAAPFGLHLHLNPWIELALATPVQFVIGARFYQGAWKALRAYSGNMDLLVALGTSAAYAFSAYMVLVRGAESAGHLYFEGAAAVITSVMFGMWLEARATRGATAA